MTATTLSNIKNFCDTGVADKATVELATAMFNDYLDATNPPMTTAKKIEIVATYLMGVVVVPAIMLAGLIVLFPIK